MHGLNLGRRGGSIAGIEAALFHIMQDKWDIVWLSELDAFQHVRSDWKALEQAFWPHTILRHYGGQGNCAMAWIILGTGSSVSVKLGES